MSEQIQLNCPLCNTKLLTLPGARDDEGNIISTRLECPSYACPAQEVFGVGRTYKEAYQVILDKYKK